MQFYGLVFFRKALAGSKFISKGKAEMDRRILEAFEDCPVVAAIKIEKMSGIRYPHCVCTLWRYLQYP